MIGCCSSFGRRTPSVLKRSSVFMVLFILFRKVFFYPPTEIMIVFPELQEVDPERPSQRRESVALLGLEMHFALGTASISI